MSNRVPGRPQHGCRPRGGRAPFAGAGGQQESKELIQSLKDHVLKELGKIAVPQEIDIVPSLPKTRSGKIMRRVLKAKELGQDVGDISTLED